MMIFLLVIAFPILEIWFLIRVGGSIGFVNTLFALIAAGVLGIGFAKSQGRYLFQKLQATLSRGEAPTSEVVQALLVFIGGVLFLIPGFISDFVGLLFVLPGTRHLIAALVRRRLVNQMLKGKSSFRVFTTSAGGGGFSGGFGGFGTRTSPNPFESSNSPRDVPFDVDARDVTPKVIDVIPITSSRRSPKNQGDSDQ